MRLRLRHLDAPELKYCGGHKARNLLESLVNNKRVVIQEKILDQQGRAMALIYQNNTLVNLKMIQSGWTRFHHDQTSVAEELKKAAGKAKEEKMGIFGPGCYQTENLDRPECNIKGNIDKVTHKRLYFYPGCAQYKFAIVEKDIGGDWFCSKEEARKAGFARAKTCP